MTFDSNLFRLPAGESPTGLNSTSRSDFWRDVFLGADVYKPIGRQVLRLDLNVSTSHYDRYSFLDYTAFNGLAAFDWRVGSQFSGTLSYAQQQALSSFVDNHTFERNVNTARIATSENEYWLLPDWHLTAGWTSTNVTNSAESLNVDNLDEHAVDAGIKYLTYRDNYVRLSWREAWGYYPNEQFVAGSFFDNRYEQTDVALDYYQAPTGASQLTARLAYTDRRMPNLPQRNFSGPTGRLSWDWLATGKLGFDLVVRREISSYTDLVTNYVITSAVRFAPYYLVTEKVRIDASYERQRRDYKGDPDFVVTGQSPELDFLNFFAVTASWDITRRWKLTGGWQHSSRSSNVEGYDFSDQTVFTTLQYKWD